MNLRLFVLCIFISNAIYPQQSLLDTDFQHFKVYVFNIVEDTSDYWSEYPKPPKIPDYLLWEIKKEIGSDDSAKYFIDHLSFEQFKHATDYNNAFRYIKKMDYDYTLLALAVHWNPDLRVKALSQLNEKLTIRPLINSVKMKNGDWEKFDQIGLEFLLYVLESNPLFINGSENATIHNYYISNILWCIDLITHENFVKKDNFSNWYKNDLQFENAVLQWKSHLK